MFNNAGTFTKLGSGYAQFSYNNGNGMVFNNTGTVDVQEGDLHLDSGGTHTGDFSIAAGSTLWLGGTHSFAATSDITGAGTVNVYGGTTDFNGQLSAGSTIARQRRNCERGQCDHRRCDQRRGRNRELQQHDHRRQPDSVERHARRQRERHVHRRVDLERPAR